MMSTFGGLLLRACGSQSVSYAESWVSYLDDWPNSMWLGLLYCGRCLWPLETSRLLIQQGRSGARLQKFAGSQGGKGDLFRPGGASDCTSASLPFSSCHHPHRPQPPAFSVQHYERRFCTRHSWVPLVKVRGKGTASWQERSFAFTG
jgi:hypothetical protein